MPPPHVFADGDEMSEIDPSDTQPTKRKMPPKQRVFIDRYLVHFNASRAAREAGYSPKTAYSIGQELLNKPEVSEEIEARLKEIHMSTDEAMKLLADMARGDLAQLMDITPLGFTLKLAEKNENGELIISPYTKLIKKIKQKTTTFIAKKESDEDREVYEIEIELYDAQAAIDKILRVAGKYKETTTNVNVDLTTLTTSQLDRLAKGEDVYTVLSTPSES